MMSKSSIFDASTLFSFTLVQEIKKTYISVQLVERSGVNVQNLKQYLGHQHQFNLSFLLTEALKSARLKKKLYASRVS